MFWGLLLGVAGALKQALTSSMTLFVGAKDVDFLVVDINYFPGYEKLPNHSALMVDFLQSLLNPTKERGTLVQRHLSSCLDDPGSDSE